MKRVSILLAALEKPALIGTALVGSIAVGQQASAQTELNDVYIPNEPWIWFDSSVTPSTIYGGIGSSLSFDFTIYGLDIEADPTTFVTADPLPSGVSLNPTTGVLSGMPTQVGDFPITVHAIDAEHPAGSSRVFTVSIAPSPPPPNQPWAWSTGGGVYSLPNLTLGLATSFDFKTLGSDPEGDPITFVTPNDALLPPGMTLGTDGILRPIPSQPGPLQTGTYDFSVSAYDANVLGVYVSADFTVTVSPNAPWVWTNPPSLPDYTVGDYVSLDYKPFGYDPEGDATAIGGANLPPGLSVTNGVLAGTLNQAGTYSFQITAYDQYHSGGSAHQDTIVVAAPPPNAPWVWSNPPTSLSMVQGSPIQAVDLKNFGSDPESDTTTFAAVGALPAGISLTTVGILSGTPTETGNFAVTVRASDASNPSGTTSPLNITVDIPNTPWAWNIGPGTYALPNQTLGGYSTFDFKTLGNDAEGDQNTFFVQYGDQLPSGLNLGADGVLKPFQTQPGPLETGTFNFSVAAYDPDDLVASEAANFTLTVLPNSPWVWNNPPALPDYNIGTFISVDYANYGYDPEDNPTAFGATNLPPGLVLTPEGVLAGTFDTAGTYTFQIRASDQYNLGVVHEDTIVVSPLPPPNQPWLWGAAPSTLSFTVGAEIGPVEFGLFGSDPEGDPTAFSVSGALPDGLSLDSAGVLTGTPTQAGAYSFNVLAADAAHPSGVSHAVAATIAASGPPPSSGTGITYEYDALGRLIKASYPGSDWIEYVYDPNGNRESVIIAKAGVVAPPDSSPGSQSADIVARVDDLYQLYVNGELVLSGANWQLAQLAEDIELSPGDVVAFRAVDTYGPGGAFVDIAMSDGTRFATSSDWKFSNTETPGWNDQGFDDSGWASAVEFGAINTPPWDSATDGLPQDSTGKWIWDATNTMAMTEDNDVVYFRFVVPSAGSSNTPPSLANAIADQTVDVGDPFNFTVAASTFTDADSDPLSYSATLADGSALPAWLTFNAGSRTFTGTPGAAASIDVRVTAQDPAGASASDVFTITIAAAASQEADIVARVDDLYQLYVNGDLVVSGSNWEVAQSVATDLSPGDVVAFRAVDTYGPGGAFVDITMADGTRFATSSAWKFSNTQTTGWNDQGFDDSGWASAVEYGVINTPPWDSATDGLPQDSTGKWIWDATNTMAMNPDNDVVYFRFVVPSSGASNTPPSLANAISDQSASVGDPFNFTVAASTFTDADNDPLSYTATLADGSALPGWLTFNSGSRTFTGTPGAAASIDVRVAAQDPAGASVSDVFTIAIGAAASQDADIVARVDDAYQLFVNGVQVLSGSNWEVAQTALDIELSSGDVIAMEAVDAWGPGGVFVDITLADGTRLATSSAWKFSNTQTAGWNDQGFDDSGWASAVEYGVINTPPWDSATDGLPQDSAGQWIWDDTNTTYMGPDNDIVFLRFVVP